MVLYEYGPFSIKVQILSLTQYFEDGRTQNIYRHVSACISRVINKHSIEVYKNIKTYVASRHCISETMHALAEF